MAKADEVPQIFFFAVNKVVDVFALTTPKPRFKAVRQLGEFLIRVLENSKNSISIRLWNFEVLIIIHLKFPKNFLEQSKNFANFILKMFSKCFPKFFSFKFLHIIQKTFL